MYVFINQSSHFLSLFSSPSFFCSLLHIPELLTSSHMQACTVCMYACVHIGVHCWQDGVSLRGSNTDGNPSYGFVRWKPLVRVCHVLYYFPIETRETSQQVSHLSGCTRVCIYAGALYACVWWDWISYMDSKGLKRWKRKEKEKEQRVQDRYSEMDVCA